MAGLSILKHMHNLSDEDLCARWVENPYFQLFLRRGVLPAQAALRPLVADALAPADGRGAARGAAPGEPCGGGARPARRSPPTYRQVIVDTTVQPKNVMFPTDAKLMQPGARAAGEAGQENTASSLRQSYARVGKLALIKHQRYAHAKQFKRANRALTTLRTYLGRAIRDIVRKIAAKANWRRSSPSRSCSPAGCCAAEASISADARSIRLHAPEVECIGKGKAHAPYEFGVKVSLATTLNRSKGGQFIAHAKALPGNPYDGHTLATVIPEIEAQIGANLARIVADAGYRGHNAPPSHKFKVYISGQKRRVTDTIKRELRTPRRRRTGHRPRQDRAPHGPQLSRPPTATPSTPSSPPPATTSAASYLAELLAAAMAARLGRQSRRKLGLKPGLLHGRRY